MDQIQFSCAAPEQRSRVSVLLRYFLMIPHMIVLVLYGIAAEFVVFFHWFAIVFTGKHNQGMWNFTEKYARYSTRVNAYMQLQHDQFPQFGPDDPSSPVQVSFPFVADANRLTNALRIFWMIPAAIIAYFLSIGAAFVMVISWIIIVGTGKQPAGMHQFIGKVLRYSTQVSGYALLLVDTYPSYS